MKKLNKRAFLVVFGILLLWGSAPVQAKPPKAVAPQVVLPPQLQAPEQAPAEPASPEVIPPPQASIPASAPAEIPEITAVRQTLASQEKQFGKESLAVAETLLTLGKLLSQQAAGLPEAQQVLQRAATIYEKKGGRKDDKIRALWLKVLDELAVVQERNSDWAGLEASLKETLTQKEHEVGIAHPTVASSLDPLIELYMSHKRFDEAELLNQRALSIREKLPVFQHETARNAYYAGQIALARQDTAAAEKHFIKALNYQRRGYGDEHVALLPMLQQVVRLYVGQNRLENAEPYLQRMLLIEEKHMGRDNPSLVDGLYMLTMIYSAQKKYDQAASTLKRVLDINTRLLGTEHPDVKEIRANLEVLQARKKVVDDEDPLAPVQLESQ